MTENLILWELKKIHKSLIKTEEEHTPNFGMIKPIEKFNLSEPILDTTKLDLIRLSVYNSDFNVNRRNNQFLYASTVVEGETIAETLSSNNKNNTDSNITSGLNCNFKGIPLLFSTVTPGAYDLTEIAESIKEETDVNVKIEPDKNTMKCKMEMKQRALRFDVDNSIASLLGYRKVVYKPG